MLEVPFSAGEIVIIACTFAFAAAAKGITGLGFSTTCLSILAATIGLKEALPVLIIPSLASNVVVMVGAGGFRQSLGRFWPLLIATIPGIAAGVWMLSILDGKDAAGILGVILLGYCGFAALRPDFSLKAALVSPLQPLVGALTGFINGLTGSQVMPVLPYLMSLKLAPNQFVQTINCSFTLCSIAMAVGLSTLGLMTPGAALGSVLAIPIVIGGVRFGEAVRRRMPVAWFRRFVLGMLAFLAIALIIKAV